MLKFCSWRVNAYTTSCVVRNLGRTTTWLVLHEVADHLLAVAARAPVADVYPLGLARGGSLPDELVKREAARVGRGFHAPVGGVELRRAVAAVDADGVAEVGPQRLQDVEAELLEVADGREGRRVVYAPRDGDEGGGKLREAEVF